MAGAGWDDKDTTVNEPLGQRRNNPRPARKPKRLWLRQAPIVGLVLALTVFALSAGTGLVRTADTLLAYREMQTHGLDGGLQLAAGPAEQSTWLFVVSFLGILVSAFALIAYLLRRTRRAESSQSDREALQQQLAEAVECAGDAFAIYDPDDRLVICNDAYRRTYDRRGESIEPGMTFEQICRQALQNGMIRDAEGRAEHWLAGELERQQQASGLHTQRLADGRWIQTKVRRLNDGGTVCVRTDITKFKESQDRMVESEARFRDFTAPTSDWLWETGPDHRFTIFTRAGADANAVLLPNVLGRRQDEIALVENQRDEDAMRTQHGKLDARQPFRDFEFRVHTEEGELRTVRSSGVPCFDDDGSFLGYRGTSRDVTEELEAERRASHAQEKLVEAIESIQEAFSLYDAEDRLVLCNSRYREIYAISAPAMKEGATFEEIIRYGAERGQYRIPGGDVEAWVQKRLKEHAVPGQPVEQELADGRWLLITERRTKDGGRVGVRSDITAFKSTLRDLQKARDEAEAASTVKSEFLAVMSHEIRTPMNGVLGMLGLVLDTDLDPEQRSYLLTARDSGEMLLTLIDDILDFSKMEAGKLTLEETDFSIAEVVEGVAELLAPRAHDKGIEIGGLIDPSMPAMVRGDPGRLRQVLLNLAGNAVKFTQAGGVSIEIQLDRESETELVATGRVIDTGIGIPKDKQSQLFSEFTQLDASYSRKFGGTGLGLAITRRLIELMNGVITVSSAPGHGSIFTFSFALKRAASTDAAEAEPATRRPRHVLVAETNNITRSLLVRQLEADGHRASFVENTESLVDALQQSVVDLVLLDPRFDDAPVTDLIRQIGAAASEIPVFLMLPFGSKPERWLSVGDKVAGAMVKPMRRDSLRRLVNNMEGEGRFGDADTPSEPQQADGDDGPGGARILLAEDSQTNRLVATAILRRAGFQVDAVADGFEAVQAARRFPYDIILMDVSMPGMDGLEAAREIRGSRGAERSVPIIALTAHAMEGDKERCIDAGMDDYIAKPVRRDELMQAIRRTLRKRVETEPEVNGANGQTPPDAAAPVTPNGGSDPDLLDEGTLVQLAHDAGSEAVGELLATFLEEMENRVSEMVSLAEQGAVEALGRNAHSLKSSSGSFGARRMQEVAAAIEQACTEGRDSEACALTATLPQFSTASKAALSSRAQH